MDDFPKAEQPKHPFFRALPVLGKVALFAVAVLLLVTKFIAPQFERAAERKARPVEAILKVEDFPSKYIRRFEDLVHTYRKSYLTDGVAYERMPLQDGGIPDGVTVNQAVSFMRDRVYSLDLHFETVWGSQQRNSGRLPVKIPRQQRSYRKTFVGDVAFLMEVFAKAYNVELSYIIKPTYRQRVMAVQHLKNIMADEPDDTAEGKAVQTILDGMIFAASGLLACDVVDLDSAMILQDLNYFVQWGMPVDKPKDFSMAIRDLLRDRTRTAKNNRDLVKRILSYCQSVEPEAWATTDLINPVAEAYLRAIQISLSEQLPPDTGPSFMPQIDDHSFARRMHEHVYLRIAWQRLIQRTVNDFSDHNVVQKGWDELIPKIEKEFGLPVETLQERDAAAMLIWSKGMRESIDLRRAEQFKKTVEAFPSSANLAEAGFTPGTPAREIVDRLRVLEIIAAISLGSPERSGGSLRELRDAHSYLVKEQ